MTPWFFTSSILVNIFNIPTILFRALIHFNIKKTSVITTTTLGPKQKVGRGPFVCGDGALAFKLPLATVVTVTVTGGTISHVF